VAEVDADAFAVGEVVLDAGAEHALKSPIRMMTDG